jgi:hypothetical protein
MFGRAVLSPAANGNVSNAGSSFRVLTLIASASADVQTWAHEFYFEVSGMPPRPVRGRGSRASVANGRRRLAAAAARSSQPAKVQLVRVANSTLQPAASQETL